VDIDVPGLSFTLNTEEDIRKDMNDVEFRFVIGGLFDWKLAKGTIVVDQRFVFGLKPNTYRVVIEASKFREFGFPMAEDMLYELKMYNYTFALTVGYLF